jgi:hypothetical protein
VLRVRGRALRFGLGSHLPRLTIAARYDRGE